MSNRKDIHSPSNIIPSDYRHVMYTGIEGNISELKRAFGAGKALWKGHDGFKADVWASVISYNLVRLTRLQSG